MQATNATFRNNKRDIEFNPYIGQILPGVDDNNISYFNNCSFVTNTNSLHSQYLSHVRLHGVIGVKFTNCNFSDSRPNIDYYSYRKSRDGILGSSASFIVDNCSFHGMKYGIYATSTTTNRTFKVYNSLFNSFNGIYFRSMDNVHIVDNMFEVKPSNSYYMPIPGNHDTYGLYVENSQNFEITNNWFARFGQQSFDYKCFGVIARNTGELHKEIYRNDFHQLNVAIEAIGHNRGTSSYSGLEIRCNRFYHSAYWGHYDIYVANDPDLDPTIIQGIKQLQGLKGQPADTHLGGNIFSNYNLYTNIGEKIWYFHHNINSHPNLTPPYYNPDKIELWNASHISYDYATSCPDRALTLSSPMLLAQMEDGLTGQQETQVQLMEMTDAGNTQLMLQQVEMASERDAYDTYQHLMKTSPWLSDEVLVAVASREEGFTHAMIRDILVANPQSAKSEKVHQALDKRHSPLPGFMLAQIENGASEFGEKELLEFQVMSYQIMHDKALNQLISNTMHNPDNEHELEYLEGVLAGTDDIRYQYLLAEMLFSRADYASGMQLLGEVERNFNFEDKLAWENHQKYLSFYTLLQSWDNEEHPGFTNLPAEVLQQLEAYVNTGHRTSGKALSILQLNDAIDYQEPIYYPQEDLVKKSAQTAPPPAVTTEQADQGLTFRVFPNPGKDFITFDWCMDTEVASGSRIEIFNAAGVLLRSVDVAENCNQALISLENLQGGNYVAKFVSGFTTKNITFVVSR